MLRKVDMDIKDAMLVGWHFIQFERKWKINTFFQKTRQNIENYRLFWSNFKNAA